MTAVRLEARPVERVWGRRDLDPPFDRFSGTEPPIGEIWFEDSGAGDPPLLVKYLFTSETLSIQVHPDDAYARSRGHKRGKDEAWLVLAAEPGAVIGIGLREAVAPDRLRAAALDGSIEDLVQWLPVSAGDFFYSPAGTVHAIGAGVSLIEVQQNVDVTYRLYDYGRGRDLHLEDGIAVAEPVPYVPPFLPIERAPDRKIMAAGGAFVVERWSGPRSARLPATIDRPLTLIPVAGAGSMDGERIEAGEVWSTARSAEVVLEAGAELLVAYPGADILSDA